MKYFLALLTVTLVAVSLLFFNSTEQSGNEQHNNAPVTGLPWQIDKLPGGDTRVFGITLGQTTLDEAIELLGDDMKLAIIAAPYESGTVEAYYSHHTAGPITGKMILVLDFDPEVLSHLRERAIQDGGTRRYHLHPDDLPVAYRAPIRVINFLPSFNLDEEIVQARFGTPAEILQIDEQPQHWLYPDKGLDLILNTDGKEVLQYLRPDEFSAHREQLQKPPTANE
jgi:hypothetical protein